MLYKKISNKEKLSAIGLGCGINLLKDNKHDYKSLSHLVDYASDNGCNLIDTAPVYGDGESEKVIGKVIEKKRSKVFLATKVLLNSTDVLSIEKSCDKSLKRLRTDYIDLFQIHWPNPEININETMAVMEKLVKYGKIRYIGVSNFSEKEIQQSISYLSDYNLASIQSEYNLFERSIEKDILKLAIKEKILVLAYSPLWQGKLANGVKQLKILDYLSDKYSVTSTQIVLNYLANKKNIIPIPNTSNLLKLKENLQSLNFKLKSDDILKLDKECQTRISYIYPNEINVGDVTNKKIYTTLDQAIENKLNMSPSPLELSADMKDGNFLKPIRLKQIKNHNKPYELIEGRLRYWAWIIANGQEKKIPALIWTD